MQQWDKRPRDGEVRGPAKGDFSEEFTDWDNPEDELLDEFEDAPEGYYDDEGEDLEDGYVPRPDDPDYDLSEAAGYAGYDSGKRVGVPRWLIVVASLLLILALLLPLLLRFN